MVLEPVNTIFPKVRLIFSIVFGEATEDVEPDRAGDMTIIVKGRVTLCRVVNIACFYQLLEIGIYNKWRPHRVSNSVKEIRIYYLIVYIKSKIINVNQGKNQNGSDANKRTYD